MPKGRPGYLLDVQADLLGDLRSRTVIPLLPLAAAPRPIGDLNPVFDIDGVAHVLVTQAIAAIPLKELPPRATELAREHDRIVRALDILFLGI